MSTRHQQRMTVRTRNRTRDLVIAISINSFHPLALVGVGLWSAVGGARLVWSPGVSTNLRSPLTTRRAVALSNSPEEEGGN